MSDPPKIPIPPPTEIDTNGHPIYRFPPFPKPPPGVTIISFKDFKPSGIQRPALGFPDGIELDGLGIPTCTLKIRVDDNEHVPGHPRKKKKKYKRRGGALGHGGKRLPWWEEWAEDEGQRGVRDMDPELPARDRYAQAGNDFTSGRRMNAETQSIYDHFALFTGLLGRNLQPPLSRHAKEILRQQAGAENDFDSDNDLPDMTPVPPKPKVNPAKAEDDGDDDSDGDKPPPTSTSDLPQDTTPQPFSEEVDPADAEAFQRQVEEEEDSIADRMSSFLNDPVFSMKVFLSSHFRDKGLIWNNAKLEHAPILIEFFLQFIIRNKVLPELKPKLLMALTIIERAKLELPATAKIGYAIPDDFAKAASGTWGAQQGHLDPPEEIWRLASEAIKATPFTFSKKKNDDIIELKTEGAENEESTTGAKLDTNVNLGGWGVEADVEVSVTGEPATGWGTSAAEYGAGGWGSSGEEGGAGQWARAEEEVIHDWDMQGPKFSFISFFGPIPIERSFAHHYQPVVVEDNLRSIEKIYQPGEMAADGVDPTWETEQLAVVILKPWMKPKDSQLRDSMVCMIPSPDEKEPAGSKPAEISEENDTRSEAIHALVPPGVAKVFVPGMILGGIFVKIAQTTTENDQKSKEWWYIEKVVQTLPSYYKELNTAYINNLVQFT